jgi:NitT/TauT family transport system substrate-binding protein
MLVEQARLPEPIKDTYRVNTYPLHQAPAQAEVDAVLAWMDSKGLLTETVTYENLVLLMP